jgi:hypothetical protein
MVTVAHSQIEVRQAILQVLGEADFQPMDLLMRLGTEYPDSDIKRAVSELIHEGKIELTSHRQIRIAESAA